MHIKSIALQDVSRVYLNLKKPSFEQNCFAWLKKCFMKNLMIANRRQDELQRQSLLLYAYTPGDNGNIYCDQI